MKRIAFMWVTVLYDFTTKEEAYRFVKNNLGKYWIFGEVYENSNNNGMPYSVEVKKPYDDVHNPGW